MRRSSIVAVWRAISDVAINDRQRRAAFGVAELRQGVFDARDIVSVTDVQCSSHTL